MVFPNPAGVLLKDEIMATLENAPRWSHVTLEEHRLLELSDTAAVVGENPASRSRSIESA